MSIKNNAVPGAASRRHSIATSFYLKDSRVHLQPLGLRELPHWLLAMTFVILAASDFRPPWVFDEPLEHFSQPAEEKFPLRFANFNFRRLLKNAAHAARIKEEEICHSTHGPRHQPRSPSAIEAC